MRFWLVSTCASMLSLGLLSCAKAVELPNQALTLEECIALARAQNPSLAIAHQEVVSAGADLEKARSAYYPSAALIAARGRTGGSSFVETPAGAIAFTTSGERREAEVALTQTIWETGRRESVSGAQHSLAASRARERSALQDLLLSVSQLYYAALASERLVEVAQATLTAARNHEQLVKARAAVGEAPRVDIAPAEAEVAEAEFALLQAKNDAALGRARLKNEMGLPPTYELRLAPPQASAPGEELPTLPDALQAAGEHRPELLAVRSAIRASEQNLRLAKALETGAIGLSAQYERGLTGPKEGVSWSAVLSATAFLFDPGSRRAGVASARAARDSLRAQEQQLVNAIGLEVESALLQIETARKSVQAAEKAVTSAEAQLAAAEGKYREGVGIFVEILDAQKAVTRARTNHVQASYNCDSALVALRRAMGQLI